MALTLVVLSGSTSDPVRLTLDSPRIVVGRASNSDIRLPDYSVSLRHASFRQRGSDYLIVDEGSTNGTFVGPVKLSPQAPRVIRSGDRVRFGRIWVELLLESVPATTNAQLVARGVALRLIADALSASGEDTRPRLVFRNGADRDTELVIERAEHRYVLGRASTCDLVLSETNASRRHVEVFKRSSQVYARDLGSKNGTVLAGLPLPSRSETVWPADAEMRIGSDRILIVDPVASALSELEQAADEVLPPDEEIPIPNQENAGCTGPSPPRATARSAARRPTSGAASTDRGGVTKLDVFVGVLALLVLGVSLLGLFWLLGGH